MERAVRQAVQQQPRHVAPAAGYQPGPYGGEGRLKRGSSSWISFALGLGIVLLVVVLVALALWARGSTRLFG